MVFYAGKIVQHPAMENPTSSSSQTATIWTTSFSTRSHFAKSCCGKFRCRRRAGNICASCWMSPAAAWCSPRFRNSFPMKRAASIRCCPTGATSWSSPTKRTAANTISLTASPSTCAMRCPRRRSSASPARRLKAATRTRRPCSAITLTFTTSCNRRKTRPPCRFITRRGWRRLI